MCHQPLSEEDEGAEVSNLLWAPALPLCRKLFKDLQLHDTVDGRDEKANSEGRI